MKEKVMAARVNGLSVVLLLSDDPSRTAAFYRDILGLELIAEEHGGRHPHYACVLGSLYFTIQYANDFAGSPPSHGPDSMQMCFTVADMDAFRAHVKEHGVTPLHPPRPFEHTVFTTLRDPDGRTLRVMTPWK
jgi:catechol 2,3-dioxygenase-like lactoylglutathione lyase family enzyme